MRILAPLLAASLCVIGCDAAPPPPAGAPSAEQAWAAFCDDLKQAGLEVLDDAGPELEIDRAEALRYLAQQLAATTTSVLDEADPSQPLMLLGAHKLNKWGLDSADAKYLGAKVRGGGHYRVHGKLGSAHFVAMQLYRDHPEYEAFASITGDALQAAADGSFELVLSAERPEGVSAWLPLDPRATNFLVREYFQDWESEAPGEFMIERIDEVEPPAPLGLAAAQAQLQEIAERFGARAPMWLARMKQARLLFTNRLVAPRVEDGQGLGDNAYGAGWFELAPDEALLIELDAPQAQLWSFQLGNFWWESIDYLSHLSSLNGHQAVPSSDGRYRLVIALEDPGVSNWLDPAGHSEGMVLYRYQRATTIPAPEARRVPLAELRDHLPPDTPHVTPEERRQALRQRRAHAARRWAP